MKVQWNIKTIKEHLTKPRREIFDPAAQIFLNSTVINKMIEAKKCKDINDVRFAIDEIDANIVKLISKNGL